MSRLQFFGRPWVQFDAANQQHRTWFAEFQQTRTWGRCPVRFILGEASSNLITQIQRELVDYYVNTEFRTKANPDNRRLA